MTRRTLTLALLATVALGAPATLAADVHVASSISPRPARFGDLIHATLTVRGDGPVNPAGGLRALPGRARVCDANRHRHRWRFDLQCLEAGCAPGPGRAA